MTRTLSILFALTAACGGSAQTTTAETTPVAVETSGGDEQPQTVVVLQTTTPVPVPQPAVARQLLPEALQQLWTRTEEIVAIRPPDPPTEASVEAIAAWSEDPFVPWVGARQTAIQQAEGLLESLGDDAMLRAIAAGLFGYMYEETAAGIRGAPVPVSIAEDEELLAAYTESLSEALRPFAQRAVESYAFCATTFVQLQQEPWAPWAQYCFEHGREVGTIYELTEEDFPDP